MLNLIENPGVTELIETETQSTGTILKMILVLANVVREIVVDKIKQSDGYACLTDEVTDISNICNLLTTFASLKLAKQWSVFWMQLIF